jgi:hypothetical protein
MTVHEITIAIDEAQLTRYSDGHLATLWHVAQANPAPHADKAAGELAERIGREVIRRWLRTAPTEVYHHQGRDYYWHQLTRFAKYTPPAGTTAFSEDWHHGEWTLKPEVIQAATSTSLTGEQAS